MTPAARLQAAIEILDEVIASARDDGPPADIIVTRYFKHAPLRRFGRPPGGARAGVSRDPPVGGAAGERARGDARAGGGRPGLARAVRPAARAGADRSTARRGRRRRRSRLARARAFAAGRRETNGRRCSNARRSTCASMPRARRATTLLAQFPGADADAAQPVGHPAPVRQPGRRSSGLSRTAWSRCRTRAAS